MTTFRFARTCPTGLGDGFVTFMTKAKTFAGVMREAVRNGWSANQGECPCCGDHLSTGWVERQDGVPLLAIYSPRGD